MSPIRKFLRCIFILYMLRLVSAASESGSHNLQSYQHLTSDQEPGPKSTPRLSNPLTVDNQKIYMCKEKNLLIFLNNGSIFRTIPLKFTCNTGITPAVGASRKVYLVAGNRVLRINTMKTQRPENSTEVLLGPETGVEGMNEIIGISVSITSSCVIVTIKRKGLFSYSYDGKLRWSTGPKINRLGYRQGCRTNLTDCYFISAPVIDHCDANVYVLNNQGELYSVSIRSPHFKWIRDINSLGENFVITAGNNGKLYVTVPETSIVVCFDVETGILQWQKSVGPLSTENPSPVVDINGWISIASLDGFLYSVSPSGFLKKYPRANVNGTVMELNPILGCSGYAVYIAQRKLEGKISENVSGYTYVTALKPMNVTFKLLVPATGFVYWSESYPNYTSGSLSDRFYWSDLRRFVLDESVFLAFLSIANIGNPLSCFSTRQKLATSCSMMEPKYVTLDTGNEKAITLFLFFETIVLVILVVLVRFCCIFWKKKKVQKQDLGKFLQKRNSLRIQKKVFDRTITELQKKASEGTSTNEVIEKIGDLVREREGIERKLSTTYSLGKDTITLESKTLIPLSDKKSGNFSCRSGRKESVEIESCSDDEVLNVGQTEVKIADEGDDQRDLQSGGGSMKSVGRSMRRRSLSLTSHINSRK